MMQNEQLHHTSLHELMNEAWKLKAQSQGLVCLVCKNVPKLERRPEFFDTGLCAGCSGEIEAAAG